MILYRPVGLKELELIYDSGMKAFPARLPQQPIFYPVLQLEYARQIASDWNAKNGQFAGYVTQFKVEDEYLSQFETHTVGESQHQEFWISAEELEEFNKHITGHIKVLEAHFGDAFEGFVPEKFGLQGKNAVSQFTQLANSFVYTRMDFYLEIKRNHKAVFLNYPFWQRYDFKNQGLKGKTLQAIREAWLTSFPKTPLADPVQEDLSPVKQIDSHPSTNPIQEDVLPVRRSDSDSSVNSARENIPPAKHTNSYSLVNPIQENPSPAKQKESHARVNPVYEKTTPEKQPLSHYLQGVELGLSGKYREAIAELSKAVEEERNRAVAYTSLGVAFHRAGEDDRALACYETALKTDPKYAEPHYFRANILNSQGKVREAIAEYTIAIGLLPELIEVYQKNNPSDRLTDYTSSVAEMYSIAKPAYRILDYNKTIESNPRQAHTFKERAAEYSRLWNYEQAIADYSSSLEIQPDDANVLHLRGLAYEQIGQFERARQDYQQASILNPRLSDEFINRGVNFGKTGNFRQSIASLTDGIRLAPGNPNGYFNRGITYFQQGDFERAIEDLSKVIQLSPGDDAAYYWRGISNEEADRNPQAIADYRQFIALSQNPHARKEIEQKLRRWNADQQGSTSGRDVDSVKEQKTIEEKSEKPEQNLDLYDLIITLGERALDSTWLANGVDCQGEKAEALYAFTDQDKPIDGRNFLDIASGIRQTIAGDFQAFDPGAASPWIFIRAWKGKGFYIEINVPESKELLKTHFQAVEEVEGAQPPYEGIFIPI